MLKIGDMMPDFEVIDQDGRTVSSKDLIGRKTVIYFYPKESATLKGFANIYLIKSPVSLNIKL